MNDEQMREIKRHFDVVAEQIESKLAVVAEGHDVLRRQAEAFRDEVRREFGEVKSLVRFSYAELDQRIQRLEQDVEAPGRGWNGWRRRWAWVEAA